MKNRDVVQQLYAAFNSGDMNSVLACMDQDVAWSSAESNPLRPEGRAVLGKEAVIAQVFAKLGNVFDDLRAQAAHLWDAGAVVVAEGRYNALHAATRSTVDHQFCHVWTLRDGLVVKFQQYTDTAKLQAALCGALERES